MGLIRAANALYSILDVVTTSKVTRALPGYNHGSLIAVDQRQVLNGGWWSWRKQWNYATKLKNSRQQKDVVVKKISFVHIWLQLIQNNVSLKCWKNYSSIYMGFWDMHLIMFSYLEVQCWETWDQACNSLLIQTILMHAFWTLDLWKSPRQGHKKRLNEDIFSKGWMHKLSSDILRMWCSNRIKAINCLYTCTKMILKSWIYKFWNFSLTRAGETSVVVDTSVVAVVALTLRLTSLSGRAVAWTRMAHLVTRLPLEHLQWTGCGKSNTPERLKLELE